MSDLIRTLLLLAIAGAAVTVLGSAAAWWRDEERRLRRMLGRALGAPAEFIITVPDRGLGAGLNLEAGKIAVLWDGGMQGLVYRLDQLVGAELTVDDQVAARAYRNEPRRPLDQLNGDAKRVMLRLLFDNARDPDFELPLWPPADSARLRPGTTIEALQAARRWISSVEAVLRQQSPSPAMRLPEAQPPPNPAEALPLFAMAEEEEQDGLTPPWDDDDDDGAAGRRQP